MVDTIAAIMVQVLCILGIVTKEIKQGRTSKSLLHKYITVDVKFFRNVFKEAGRKNWGQGRVEEAGLFDAGGGSNGCCRGFKAHA